MVKEIKTVKVGYFPLGHLGFDKSTQYARTLLAKAVVVGAVNKFLYQFDTDWFNY